jgi:hypothetical protein
MGTLVPYTSVRAVEFRKAVHPKNFRQSLLLQIASVDLDALDCSSTHITIHDMLNAKDAPVVVPIRDPTKGSVA